MGFSKVTDAVGAAGGTQGIVGGGLVVRGGWVFFFLTANFFICFVQLLQGVQQLLWGEDVRGSWGGGRTP